TFKNKSIETQALQEIFAYASWAPTHYKKEPWEIKLCQAHGKVTLINKIIKSYQRLEMLSTDNDAKSVKSIKDFLFQIPHHAVICFEKEKDPIKFEEDYASVCAFIQNAQLAAWDKNIGMLWTITPFMHDPEFSS